ncbi:MAG: InlB B-repeat-containing protein [Christensenellales bacterium]
MMKKSARFLLLVIVLISALSVFWGCKAEFTISFMLDDKVWATVRTSGNCAIEMPERPTTADKPGYVFMGWYVDEDYMESFDSLSLVDTTLEYDKKIYSKWLPFKDVYFLNFTKTSDNSFEINVSNSTVSLSVASCIIIEKGTEWVLSSDMEGKEIIDDKVMNFAEGENVFYVTVTEADGITKSVYKLEVYRNTMLTVSFAPDSDNPVPGQNVEQYAKATEPVFEPSKKGYTFSGWDWDFDTEITTDTVIYAIWEPVSYEIAFDSNDGIGTMENQSMKYGVQTSLPLCTFTKDGYRFGYWRTEDGVSLKDGAMVKDLSFEDGDTVTLTAVWVVPDEYLYEISIYVQNIYNDNYTEDTLKTVFYEAGEEPDLDSIGFAHLIFERREQISDGGDDKVIRYRMYFAREEYEVTFDGDGGTFVSGKESYTVRYGATVAAPVYTREGFLPAGWSRSLENIDGDVTIRALWEYIEYPITYYLNGGVNNGDNPAYYTIAFDEIILKEPVKFNHNFLGWYTSDSTSGERIEILDTTAACAYKLYAVWEEMDEEEKEKENYPKLENTFTEPEHDRFGYKVSVDYDKYGRLVVRRATGRELQAYDGYENVANAEDFVYFAEETPEWVYNADYQFPVQQTSAQNDGNVFNLGAFNSFSFCERMFNFIRFQHITFDKMVTVSFDFNTSFVYQTSGGFVVRAKCTIEKMDLRGEKYFDDLFFDDMMNAFNGSLCFKIKPVHDISDVPLHEGYSFYMDIKLGIPLLEPDGSFWDFLTSGDYISY